MKLLSFFLLALSGITTAVVADPPVIETVTPAQNGDTWRFDVTLSHLDTGWEHYADGWRVLDEDGMELGLRVLHHPHVNEQPFTRSLGSVVIPVGTGSVQIEARCLVDGWSSRVSVDLP